MTATADDMGDMGGMAMDEAADMAATGMAGSGWSLAGLVAFVVAWAVMMAAMMFPAAAPMILLFRTVATKRRTSGGAFVPTWVFVRGLPAGLDRGRGAHLGAGPGSERPGWSAGVAERATWAPLALGRGADRGRALPADPAQAGLSRSLPLAVRLRHAALAGGVGGALQMGVVHGAYCLGCCWALFAVLVAAGVMSLAWMLLLTLVIFAEKVLPVGRRASQVVGVAFLVLGVGVALSAWWTYPGLSEHDWWANPRSRRSSQRVTASPRGEPVRAGWTVTVERSGAWSARACRLDRVVAGCRLW